MRAARCADSRTASTSRQGFNQRLPVSLRTNPGYDSTIATIATIALRIRKSLSISIPNCARSTMLYTERPPHPALARHIRCLWVFETCPADSASNIQAVVPDGCPEMVLHYGDCCREIGAGGILKRQARRIRKSRARFPASHHLFCALSREGEGRGKKLGHLGFAVLRACTSEEFNRAPPAEYSRHAMRPAV